MISAQNIRQQVALLTLIPLLILTICLEFFLLQGRFADIDQGLIERGKLIARQMASSSEYGVFSNNKEFLNVIANGALREPDVRGLLILNASSEVLLSLGEHTSATQEANPDAMVERNGSPDSAKFIKTNLMKMANPEYVSLAQPVKIDAKSVWLYEAIMPTQVLLDDLDTAKPAQQIGAVIVEMSKTNTAHTKRKILSITLVSTLLFLLVALYLVYLASRSITNPIRQLSSAVLRIAQGDLSTRVTPETKVTELNILARGMNEMAIQLQQEHEVLQQRVDQATQALREQKNDAERASHDKSRFLAVASHDLRQPLHALGLYVAELRRQLSFTQQQQLVEQVDQSIDALATLLNALLDISKLDAGAIVPQFQECNIASTISRVAGDYQMLAAEKNIKLVVRASPVYVISDPVLLERILMNLVSNAIRYSNVDGCVMVACRRRGNQLRIEVRDNGIGISQADQENVFREFFQIAKPQLDSNKGHGLGLAIVERLVKLLGHGIELRSSPGKGSLFALHVPICAEPKAWTDTDSFPAFPSLMKEGLQSLPLYGKNILIVDDDEAILQSTAAVVASWGGNVHAASNLYEVYQLLNTVNGLDLIISDYQLGVNDTGFDVIAAVHKHRGGLIPAILISGDTSSELLQSASIAGHHLMYKPVKPAKLRSLAIFLLNDANT